MFCMNCGAQIADDSKICPSCGATLNEAAAVAATPTAPAPAKKGLVGLLIGIGAAVVVAASAAALVVTGTVGTPSTKLGKAVLKSAQAYEAVYNEMGGTDFASLIAGEKYSQSANITLDTIDDDTSFDGLGLRFSADVNIPGKKIDFAVTPFYESADIATIYAGLDNETLYAGSPELTDGSFYGINTVTVGQDLAELTGTDEVESLSFNVFELIKTVKDMQNTKEMNAKVEDANKALLKSLDVSSAGQESIDVNDYTVKASKYHVVLAPDAIETYLDSLEDIVDSASVTDTMVTICEGIGMPDDVLEEMEYELDNVDTGEIFEELRYALEDMDDLELDAYVSGGYLVAVVYEGEIDGDEGTISLQLGGGKKYVDNITLVVENEAYDEVVIISSSGNHSGAGGKFSDVTTAVYDNGYEEETLFCLELSYDKKSKALEGSYEDNYTEVEFDGTLDMAKSSLDLQLSELKIVSWDYTVLKASVGYAIGAYKSPNVKTSDATMLLTLDQDELIEIAQEIYTNFTDLAEALDLDYLF